MFTGCLNKFTNGLKIGTKESWVVKLDKQLVRTIGTVGHFRRN